MTAVERGSLTTGSETMNLALASVSERISGMESSLAELTVVANGGPQQCHSQPNCTCNHGSPFLSSD
nr:hypothetical protein [Bradyrhizobium brasilense]